MAGSRTVNTGRLRIFMVIATALWFVGTIAAVMDRDTQQIFTWSCFVTFGVLIVGGLTHGAQWRVYLAIALIVVAVALSIGLFIGGVA